MKLLFWNVDTQKDFLLPDRKLYVKGAEEIIPNLQKLTNLAKQYNIKVVNTGDLHEPGDEEISSTPDYKDTFPPHCMGGTEGSSFIPETKPQDAIAEFYANFVVEDEPRFSIKEARNIILYKDRFDVFSGNRFTKVVLREINPDMVIVYGVTTDICVKYAIEGLYERKYRIVVVRDAVKEIAVQPFEKWMEMCIMHIETANLEKMIPDLLKEKK